MSHVAATADAGAGDAPTPFYDNLMSMIEATAVERRLVVQSDEVDAYAGHRRWGIYVLVSAIASLVVVVAVGRGLLVPEASRTQPPMVTTDTGNTREERTSTSGAATMDGTEGRAPAAEPPGDQGPAAGSGPRTADGGTGAAATEAAIPEAGPEARPETGLGAAAVAGRPVDSPGPRAETGGEPAITPAGGKSDQADAGDVAAAAPVVQSLPVETPSSPVPDFQTGSVERAVEPPATSAARMISDANMRAGPSNSQAVLATIARGRTVEVIGCRAWCEVIYAGQRGWVYKGFIDAPPAAAGR